MHLQTLYVCYHYQLKWKKFRNITGFATIASQIQFPRSKC